MTEPYLHREGRWFILAKKQWWGGMTYPHNSLIWHQCKSARVHGCDGECSFIACDGHQASGYQGCWRITVRNMGTPCGVCNEVCPEGIQGLFLLHNWDILSGHPDYT